jgi:hypothetical protein
MKHSFLKQSFLKQFFLKHCSSFVLWLAVAISSVALTPEILSAGGSSARIGVTATVATPLGIAEISDLPGRYLFAPKQASALVFLESDGVRFSTTLQTNDFGLLSIDYLSHKLRQRHSAPPSSADFNALENSPSDAVFLTVILTEN